MAERRMFAKTIIDSDAFLDMSASAQALYFHLSMRADDDGFVNNPRKIARMVGAAEDDLRILIAKRFIIGFESGVIVIKHWKIHNYIQGDRYKPTVYADEKARLSVKPNKSYTEADETACIQPVSKVDTQVRLGKVRLGEVSVEEAPKQPKRFIAPSPDDVKEYCRERKNRVDADKFVDYYTANGWKVGKNAMKDWKAAVRTWEKNDLVGKGGKKVNFQDYDQGEPVEYKGIDLLAEAREA